MKDNKIVECCDVTPLSYEQYDIRFEHYISDERTGKKIKIEEPITVRSIVPVSTNCSPAYVKNEIIEQMIYKLRNMLYENE